jgi:hypothetical protein
MKRLALGVGTATVAWSIPFLLSACTPDAVIGSANLAAAGACGGCLEEETDSAPGCEAADAQKRTTYDAWRTSPNDIGLFAGTVWKGRIAAEVSATLTVRGDLSAELYVGDGEPPVPTADAGFLCEDLDCADQPLFHGGVYPIHGATFAIGASEQDRNLHFELNPLSPFDAWCRLQQPHPAPAAGDSCSYGLAFSPSSTAEGPCLADGRPVDCKWLEIVSELEACTCTRAGCFATTIWAPGDPWILLGSFTTDLQYDPDAQRLSGSMKTFQHHFAGEDSRSLDLWLVDDPPQ